MTAAQNSCFLADETATDEFGTLLARLSKSRGVITLRGVPGSGKTTLCRALIRALGHQGAVKSPTYTLVEPYELAGGRVLHYDLYRLVDPEEIDYLGMRDFLDADSLTLIEWPENGGSLLPPVDLDLELSVEGKGRRLSWQAGTPAGALLAAALNSHFQTEPKPLQT